MKENTKKNKKMTFSELKPCPFCKGKAIIINNAIRMNAYGEKIIGIAIGCDNCNAQMFYREKKLAIEAWNMRAKK